MTDRKTQGCSTDSWTWQKAPPCTPPDRGHVTQPPPPASPPGFLGSGVWAENWVTGSPLGPSMPKEAGLELAKLSMPVCFSRLQTHFKSEFFILKMQSSRCGCPLIISSQCDVPLQIGITALQGLSAEPRGSTAAQVLGIHRQLPLSQPFISQSNLLPLCNHRKMRWKPCKG